VKRSIQVKVAATDGSQGTASNLCSTAGITCPEVQTSVKVDVVWRP
jgi:hypothetical protein